MSRNKSILWTTNLNLFSLVSVNRETTDSVSRNEINGIAADMKVNGFRYAEPIIVSRKAIQDVKDKGKVVLPQGKHGVVDGQHRLQAAILAGVGVYYVIDEDIPLTQKGLFEGFLKYNEWKKKVRKHDLIHGFVQMGNENFKILQEFGEKYPMFSLTERMMFLTNSGTKHPSKEQFQKGKFDISNVKTAEKWANYVLQIKPYFEKGYNKSLFVRTLLTIAEKKKGFKFEELIHKIQLRPGMIHLCGCKTTYSEMIHNIYNYKRRETEKINLRLD
jgi:hypothetical protein